MQERGEPLQQKLEETRRWWRATRIAGGVAWILCVLLGLGLLCYHVDRALALSSAARQAWRIGILLAGLGTFVAALLRPALRRLPDSVLAADVERRYPALRERLLTTIDLVPALAAPETPLPSSFSRPMMSALVEETRREVATLDFRRAVDLRPLRVAAFSAVAVFGLLALHIVFAPDALAVWLQRMASPYADIAPFAQTRVWITPESDVLPRGEGLAVAVTTRGAVAERGVLRYRLDADKADTWRTVNLTKPQKGVQVFRYSGIQGDAAANAKNSDARIPDDLKNQPDDPNTRTFQYRFPALTQSVTLLATANDGRSNERRVTVEDRPTLLNVQLTLRYPAYMKRKAQVLPESTGNIAAPVGTEVTVEGTANKPLQTAECEQDGAAAGPWKVDGEKVSGTLAVWKNGAYRVKLTDLHGFDNPAAPRFEISALKDQTPSVQIQRPAADMELVPNGSLPLVARATDDYGVSKMALAYDKLRGEAETRQGLQKTGQGALALLGANGSPQANVAVRWHIASVRPKPGDILRYEVRATDTDTLRGPHTGRSAAYRIRVVSLLEMQRRLKEQLDEELRALAQLRQRQIEAQKLLQEARQKQDEAAMTHAQDAQRAVAQETNALTERIQQLSTQLENNELATASELKRREEARQTLQNLAQQKMPNAADTIQRAQTPQPNDPSRAESLRQADQRESEIKRDIEKAQGLLSRSPNARQLAEEAARLAQQQQQLAESSRALDEDIRAHRQETGSKALTPDQKSSMEMMRRQQADARADTERLQKQLGQAARDAQERGQSEAAKALQRAAEQLQQGKATANQQQAQKSLQRNSPSSAAPSQDRAAAALQKAAEAAQQADAATNPDTPQAAAERLEQAAERLREMAERQKELAQKIGQKPNAQESRQLAQQERALQQQAQKMQQALRDTPNARQSLQSAQQNLGQSSQNLSQNNSQKAQNPANNAAQQLERAAQQAQRTAQQLRQQQMAAEMAEKVERLAQIERALQEATKRLDASRRDGSLNSNERRELGQAAAKQEANEQQAQELAQRLPSPAFQEALRMAARQMRPATRNLGKDNPDTGKETQAAQGRSAQTLEAIAQALKQQGQNNPQGNPEQGGSPQQGGGSPQQAQESSALAELMLAQGLQKILRQDTGALDQERKRNPNQELNESQRAESNRLSRDQRAAQRIAQRAADNLSEAPDLEKSVREATREMDEATRKLMQQQTGKPTQGNQEEAIRRLAQAAQQLQQQQQQQQQQQMAQQQGQQGAPQPNQRGNQPPKRAITRLEGVQKGLTVPPNVRAGRGFTDLSPRTQRALRESQQERVPAEFQDLVSRYYKSLAEKKR